MAIVLITGCSSGFGLGAAQALTRRGATVIATVREPSKAQPLEAACGGGDLEVACLDVTDPAARAATIDGVLARHGHIDVLINNAGMFSFGPAEVLGEADLRAQFETNVFAAFALMAMVLPSMRARRSGRIVNVTSVAALAVRPFMAGYCASKHALDAISSGMDRELEAFNIRVTSVAAVAFVTSIARRAPEAGTPYGDAALHPFEDFITRMKTRPDLSPAVDAIVEAATVANPRRRYIVAPGDTRFDAVLAEKERAEGARGSAR